MHEELINENLKKIDTWKRIIFMLMFALIDSLVKLLLWLVILLQTASVLLTGNTNPNLLGFGTSLATYHYHILLFLTFSSEQLPFPFAEWNLSADSDLINKN